MFKKAEHNVLFVGFILSSSLLIGFSRPQNSDLIYLELPQAWFFVSAVPIILALFVGGFIRKGSFAGFEFEGSSEKAAELIIPATSEVVANLTDIGKGSSDKLKKLTVDQKRNIKILRFKQNLHNTYNDDIIYEYLDTLLNISYFRIEREGRPSQYISVNALKLFCFSRQLNDIQGGSSRLSSTERFLSALKDDRILDEFGHYEVVLLFRTGLRLS